MAISLVSLAELVPDRLRDAVDLAGEAVDGARLQRLDGDLPMACSGSAMSTLMSLAARVVSASIETSMPGAIDAAEVVALAVDDVEVRRGAEVDDDARAPP